MSMETSTIIILVVGFLVSITFIRRAMLKEQTDRRVKVRRQGNRRNRSGRRKHDFHEACKDEDRRHREDRRQGKKDRRFHERRHSATV